VRAAFKRNESEGSAKRTYVNTNEFFFRLYILEDSEGPNASVLRSDVRYQLCSKMGGPHGAAESCENSYILLYITNLYELKCLEITLRSSTATTSGHLTRRCHADRIRSVGRQH
jgi:hypothetical protein